MYKLLQYSYYFTAVKLRKDWKLTKKISITEKFRNGDKYFVGL